MTSISKNVYIDKLHDIVNEYNNKYHRTIKMKPIYVKDININTLILILIKKLMIKVLNFKLVIMQEYQNAKTFLLKAILQIGLRKYL